jgi:hypothetical protein
MQSTEIENDGRGNRDLGTFRLATSPATSQTTGRAGGRVVGGTRDQAPILPNNCAAVPTPGLLDLQVSCGVVVRARRTVITQNSSPTATGAAIEAIPRTTRGITPAERSN